MGMTFMGIVLLTNRYFTGKKLIAALAGGFLVAAFIILASTPVVERIRTLDQKTEVPNFKARVTVWGGVIEMIKDHPLLGTGPGTFATVFTQYQPPGVSPRYFMAHNDYLHFTSEAGLPLIAVIIWMIIVLYRKGFAKMQNPSRLVRGITIGAMTGITAILVHSIGDFNLHIPANAILFTILAALIAAPLPADNGQQGT
ncbi:MAG: O-antigen ligase family protein [Thermodesulfobacteriota bacterium]|nr:O-antigen ligase family protein [Thermodesulfobacteriota bacterium]